MWHPVSCFWSLCNSSSMYTLKRMGDNTPPWRTPLDTLMFSHSNALTACTNVPPKELRWPLCTGWILGWCRMPQMLVSIQSYQWCPIVVDWWLMLCHTQYIRNLAWNGQWPGTASGECLCPHHTSSVQPLWWDWGSPCTWSSAPWYASRRLGANPTKAQGISSVPPLADVCYQSWQGVTEPWNGVQ